MSDKNSPTILQKPDISIHPLELAVPVLSLGGVLLAMLFSGPESPIDVRYFAAGCVVGSFALAYLAWIRPRKDIVALTTPIYAIIFFMAPSDFSVNLVLELLYAASLTILLVRMKLRFGTAQESCMSGGRSLEEPLKTYCETVRAQATGLSPETAHYAAAGFARFAQGDYRETVEAADAALAGLEPDAWPLATAFAIVREQALLLDASVNQPAQFIEFFASDAGYLAKHSASENTLNARFEVALDNALLLLYAAAWTGSVRDRPLLLVGQGFALKLFASE